MLGAVIEYPCTLLLAIAKSNVKLYIYIVYRLRLKGIYFFLLGFTDIQSILSMELVDRQNNIDRCNKVDV